MELRNEFLHQPGDEKYWSESYYIDFIDPDIQGHARIGFYPNQELANVWLYVFANDQIYWIRDEEVPFGDTHGLVVRRPDWNFRLEPEELGTQWTFNFEGTALKSDTPRAVLNDEGELTELSLEFTAMGRHEPFPYAEGREQTRSERYEQAIDVTGTAELDGKFHEFSGIGERDHSWGIRQWASPIEWVWAAGGFKDNTAYNFVYMWSENRETPLINGFWFDDNTRYPLTDASLTASPAFSPATAEAWINGDPPTMAIELEWESGSVSFDAEPTNPTPIAYDKEGNYGILNRAPATYTKRNVSGHGFLEQMQQMD